MVNGKRRRETTKGWEVCIQCKDGSSTWNKIKDVKESYSIQLAEYAVQNKISDVVIFPLRKLISRTNHQKQGDIVAICSQFVGDENLQLVWSDLQKTNKLP